MTRLRLLIAVSLLVISFGRAQTKFFVDDDLFDIFNEAIQELRTEGLWDGATEHFVIKFYNTTAYYKRVAAAYGRGNDKLTFIMINRKMWKKMSYYQKRFIVMHELGHDYYNLGHEDCLDSIMRHDVPDDLDMFDLDDFKKNFYETIRTSRGY